VKQCGPAGWLGSRCTIEPPCSDLTFTAYGTNALHYREVEGYKPLRDNVTSEMYLAYGRPIYAVTAEDTFDILVHTGNRWFNAIFSKESFEKESFNASAPFHAFWDGIDEKALRYYSDPIDPALPVSSAPVKMGWTFVSSPSSRQNFGPYSGSHDASESDIHWNFKEGCTHICGENGECVSEEGASSRTCECNNCYGGYFCSIAPQTSYVRGISAYYPYGPFAGQPTRYNQLFWNENQTCLSLAYAPFPDASVRE